MELQLHGSFIVVLLERFRAVPSKNIHLNHNRKEKAQGGKS
jgi:hypothetical protein